ncbi:Uncharacterised protein [Pseudomonas putida]|nr:Uncharacterised protein [Pseudomonas putida]
MRCQLGAAQHAHAQRGEGEQADFHHVGATNRQAQPPQLAQGRQRRARQALAQWVGGIGRVPTDIQRQGNGHAHRHHRGDQADAHQAQLGQAEHAFDQRHVEQVVEHRADQADDHHRRRPAQRAGEAAQRHEGQVAGQRQWQQGEEFGGRCNVFGLLPEQQQYRFKVPQHQRSEQRQAPGQPQATLRQAGGALDVVGALANGHQGADRSDHAKAEDRHERVARRTQAAASQGLRADAGHHQGIGQHHQHVRQLRGDQRPGQAQQSLEFCGGRDMHGGSPFPGVINEGRF